MPAPTPEATGPHDMDLSHNARSLLAMLTVWQEHLARRLVQDHHTITGPDLNCRIISVILQLLFLKTGQEVGLVEPGTLGLLAESAGIGKRMERACSDAGLTPEIFFESGPDGFREVICRMDVPDFPVPLSRLSVEEVAVVLEQFLGTRMQVGEGYRVVRVAKSAMLYTGAVDIPSRPVIDFIVKETFAGSRTELKTDPQSRVRVLDPACGAGMFLLAAYRYLIMRGADPHRILSRSLFGTDIDPESVSAARFIQLLAFIQDCKLSGPAPPSPGRIREISLCLTGTIRCGNTLIAPDYFSGKPVYPFNADERQRVNPFDWQETFPGIIRAGGFDAVIGAPPPYRPFAVQAREEYFQTHYEVYARGAGLYGYFIEKGLSLLKPEGFLAFLIPGTFLRSHHARPLRRLLLSRQILRIADTGKSRLMQDGESRIYMIQVRNRPPDMPFAVTQAGPGPELTFGSVTGRHSFTLDQRSLDDGGWNLADTRTADIIEKIRATGTPLDQYVIGDIVGGTTLVRNNPFIVDAKTKSLLTKKEWPCRRMFVPLLRPADIRRYIPERPGKFVVSANTTQGLKRCRALWKYLRSAAGEPVAGMDTNGSQESAGAPELNRMQDPPVVRTVPKIIFAQYQHVPAFTCDQRGSYAITGSLLAIPHKDPYLAAILNSSLGRFLICSICTLTDRGYHLSPAQLGKFPVITPDFDKLADKTRHNKMVALVTQMLTLHGYLPKAKTDQERRLVQQEIEATDVKIDALVYELYGLTVEEIGVIERDLTDFIGKPITIHRRDKPESTKQKE
jgi:hypothetical protein